MEDDIDYHDFYTKHWNAIKFRRPNALQPLDVQSLCSELCASRLCCSKYAPEKLQTPKLHHPSVAHSDLALHTLSNKPTVQLENGTGIKQNQKLLHVSSKVTHQNWVFAKHPLIQDVYFHSRLSLQQEKAGNSWCHNQPSKLSVGRSVPARPTLFCHKNNISIKSRKSVSVVEGF